MTDFDEDKFLRDFPPDESQTQKDPGENLDDSQLNHVLRSSNIETPMKQETLQDAKSLPNPPNSSKCDQTPPIPDQNQSPEELDANNTGAKPEQNLQKNVSSPTQKSQVPSHHPVKDPNAQPKSNPKNTVTPLNQS